MKYSKLMRERIRRVRVLFKELGYDLVEGEKSEETFSAAFENEESFQGGFFIDSDNKFLEIAFTFTFSSELDLYIQDKLTDMLRICYEFGCYLNIQKSEDDIEFSIYSKLYYAGINYYTLKETLRDFNGCIEMLRELVDLTVDEEQERD
ncbi:MAG: hypothetical protein HN368_13880 [Spirochaetales bacterium]|jgi:hypothetical protein|nr:hypothetical protein [Spirochaetales bacterium]